MKVIYICTYLPLQNMSEDFSCKKTTFISEALDFALFSNDYYLYIGKVYQLSD